MLDLYQTIFQKDGLRLEEDEDGCRYSVLDGAGNENFLRWQLSARTAPADWGFPDDWDWTPFDRKAYFPIPSLPEEDGDWFGEDFDEED